MTQITYPRRHRISIIPSPCPFHSFPVSSSHIQLEAALPAITLHTHFRQVSRPSIVQLARIRTVLPVVLPPGLHILRHPNVTPSPRQPHYHTIITPTVPALHRSPFNSTRNSLLLIVS